MAPEVDAGGIMGPPAVEDDEEIDDWGDQESTVVGGLGHDAWGDPESTGNGIGAEANTHPGQRTPPPESDAWRARRAPQHSEAYGYGYYITDTTGNHSQSSLPDSALLRDTGPRQIPNVARWCCKQTCRDTGMGSLILVPMTICTPWSRSSMLTFAILVTLGDPR